MSKRQTQIRQSLAVLGVERLTNFIYAEPVQQSDIRAVQFLKEALDRGEDLVAELLDSIELPSHPGDYGYSLKVTRRSTNSFWIALGCHAGPLAGDGGEWKVTFDAAGGIIRIVEEGQWIA